MSACHGEKVLDGDFLQEFRRIFRTMLRKDVHKSLIDAEFAFRHSKAYSHRCECLADRVQYMRFIGRSGTHPVLLNHIPVLDDHDAVQILLCLLYCRKISFRCLDHFSGSFGARK